MKYKYIGTIVGKQNSSGEFIVIDLPYWLPDLPSGTQIKIGYSIHFAEDFVIISWKNNKSKPNRKDISNLKASVKFTRLNSHLSTSNFNERGIFISYNQIKKIADKGYFIEDLIGYNVVNSTNGEQIGLITDFFLTSSNEIIIIKSKTQDDLIPIQLNNDCIEKIDNRKKFIILKPVTQIIELLNKL